MSIADKILLRKRALLETVNDELKNIAQIEHSRHRSFNNFIANSLSAIAAYCFFEKKPAIDVNFVNDGQLAIFWFYFEPTYELDTFTKWSKSLYLPWLYVLVSELDNKKTHTLTIRVSKKEKTKSKGTECVIRNIVINE